MQWRSYDASVLNDMIVATLFKNRTEQVSIKPTSVATVIEVAW